MWKLICLTLTLALAVVGGVQIEEEKHGGGKALHAGTSQHGRKAAIVSRLPHKPLKANCEPGTPGCVNTKMWSEPKYKSEDPRTLNKGDVASLEERAMGNGMPLVRSGSNVVTDEDADNNDKNSSAGNQKSTANDENDGAADDDDNNETDEAEKPAVDSMTVLSNAVEKLKQDVLTNKESMLLVASKLAGLMQKVNDVEGEEAILTSHVARLDAAAEDAEEEKTGSDELAKMRAQLKAIKAGMQPFMHEKDKATVEASKAQEAADQTDSKNQNPNNNSNDENSLLQAHSNTKAQTTATTTTTATSSTTAANQSKSQSKNRGAAIHALQNDIAARLAAIRAEAYNKVMKDATVTSMSLEQLEEKQNQLGERE